MNILLVDDETPLLSALRLLLLQEGYQEVATEDDPERALERVRDEAWDLVILDLNMPRVHGLDILQELMARQPRAACLILSAVSEVDTAVQAIHMGALDFLTKPIDRDRILEAVKAAIGSPSDPQGAQDLLRGVKNPEAFSGILTQSPKLVAIFRYLEQIAPTDVCVVITGPSGSGKELLARATHRLSPRRDGPFLGINVAAIPSPLFAAHLFGHTAGAFSGASGPLPGYFKESAQGTLFLDEIGDLDLQAQTLLLRAIQEREYFVVGETRPTKLSSRLVVATNLDLEEEVRAGRFRADLFYRLRGSAVRVPPLAGRPEDIPVLAEHYTRHFSAEFDKSVRDLSSDTLALLCQQPWPGNVRELQNVIREAVLLQAGSELLPSSIPETYLRGNQTAQPLQATETAPPPAVADERTLATVEREHILQVLQAQGGNVSQAARVLGISRATLNRRLKDYRRKSSASQ